ncbi:MAG: MFS transporter [Pseudomonadota bacterium]
MIPGLILLALAYVLSQFFRAFLAVLTGPLQSDLGIGPEVLATASGYWFLAFAVMQLPVGKALDTVGPRRTGGWLLLLGGAGGSALFAAAQDPVHVHLAMALIGVGCSPVLMASFYIFARQFDPAKFATLAALMIGVGTVGNLISSYPMAFAVDAMGWRNAMWALAALSAVTALGVLVTVRDPDQADAAGTGTLLDLLRIRALWFIFPIMFVNYAPVAAVRGLWIGPYLREVFDQSTQQIGIATLIMSLAMIVGTIAYGPMDRLFGTRKGVVLAGNAATVAALVLVILWIDGSPWRSVALFAAIGALGASFPVIIAHARSFFPAHLTGRGVTLMNLFGIGGVGVMQTLSGGIYRMTETGTDTTSPYVAIFGFFTVALALGVLIYSRSRDSVA